MSSLFEPQTALAIKERINQLQPTSQKLWGKMTVSQMLWHCNQALAVATNDVQIKVPFFVKLMSAVIRKKVLSKEPYKPGLPTAKEFILKEDKNFEQEKNNLLAMMDKFIAAEQKLDGKKHPVFGKLSSYEWGFTQWKHLDHHLKQFGI